MSQALVDFVPNVASLFTDHKMSSRLQVDVRVNSAQEERLDLPYWTRISAICVVEDVSIRLDILT